MIIDRSGHQVFERNGQLVRLGVLPDPHGLDQISITAPFGPWYGKVTPADDHFDVLICRDTLIADGVPESTSRTWPGDPIPWRAQSLREAKRIIRREVRKERRDEKQQAKVERFATTQGIIRVNV